MREAWGIIFAAYGRIRGLAQASGGQFFVCHPSRFRLNDDNLRQASQDAAAAHDQVYEDSGFIPDMVPNNLFTLDCNLRGALLHYSANIALARTRNRR